MTIINFPRHGQPGYYSLADLPQADPITDMCLLTGWSGLDSIFRLYPGQFVMVTGIAGHGKSTFLMNVLVQHAKRNKTKSFFYVPENQAHLMQKLRLIWGSDPDFSHHAENHFFIQSPEVEAYDNEPKTLDWVLNKAVVAVDQDGVDVVMIDPWNELERAKPREMLMTDYIGQSLMWLKAFARTKNVSVIMVAHPTKAGVSENKIPTLADIEGSMNWYNKCDNGLIVYREPESNNTRVISAKVREIGAGERGHCMFSVDKQTGIFTSQESSYWHD